MIFWRKSVYNTDDLILHYIHTLVSNITLKSTRFIKRLKQDSQQMQAFLQSTGIYTVQIERLDETDGLRIYLGNQDIVHLRPSGNAPELRCYAETAVIERSKQIVEKALAYVHSALV